MRDTLEIIKAILYALFWGMWQKPEICRKHFVNPFGEGYCKDCGYTITYGDVKIKP